VLGPSGQLADPARQTRAAFPRATSTPCQLQPVPICGWASRNEYPPAQEPTFRQRAALWVPQWPLLLPASKASSHSRPQLHAAARRWHAASSRMRDNQIQPSLPIQVATRIAKYMGRCCRIRVLSKFVKGKRIAGLLRTNAWAAGTFGHMAFGLAPDQVEAIRKSAAEACGRGSSSSCLTTILALRLGPGKDPAVVTAKEQVAWWLATWSEASDKEGIRKAWRTLWRTLQVQHRWRLVKGHTAATICTLLQYGWKAPSPDQWLQPDTPGRPGGWWRYDGGDPRDLLEAMQDTVYATLWARAANRSYHGEGLQHIPDLTPAIQLRQRYHRAGSHKKGRHAGCSGGRQNMARPKVPGQWLWLRGSLPGLQGDA